MEPAIQLKNVSKIIGKKKIIDNISLDVYPGEVFGLLGPNGAGKTTTIRMIVGLMKVSAGEIIICGKNLKNDFEAAIREVGAIVENPEMYNYLSGYQNLMQVARIMKGVTKEKINEIVKLVGLEERIHDKVKTYSLGMRQRLGIAQSLLHDPKVLILDEPTNGLDPEGIIQIRQIIQRIAANGTTIIMASHLLDEVEKICSHVVVLNKGSVLYNGSVKEIGNEEQIIELSSNDLNKLLLMVQKSNLFKEVAIQKDKLIAEIKKEISPEEINKYFFEKGIILSHLVLKKANLERQFFHLLKNTKNHV